MNACIFSLQPSLNMLVNSEIWKKLIVTFHHVDWQRNLYLSLKIFYYSPSKSRHGQSVMLKV